MFKKKRKAHEVEDIDITSLLDILVILLVFLLKSFNDSELSVELARELSLPYSLSRVAGHEGTILQINSRKNVFINNEKIGPFDDPATKDNILKQLNKEFERRAKKAKDKGLKKSFIINFVFDKSLEYKEINKIMDLSSQTGFNKYKLIIQGTE